MFRFFFAIVLQCQNLRKSSLTFGARHSLTVPDRRERYPVRETSRRRLKQVDFRFEDRELRGLEQNPDTKSKWAAKARDGKKVMQFLDGGRYPWGR
jgi:hypothetical protein